MSGAYDCAIYCFSLLNNSRSNTTQRQHWRKNTAAFIAQNRVIDEKCERVKKAS